MVENIIGKAQPKLQFTPYMIKTLYLRPPISQVASGYLGERKRLSDISPLLTLYPYLPLFSTAMPAPSPSTFTNLCAHISN